MKVSAMLADILRTRAVEEGEGTALSVPHFAVDRDSRTEKYRSVSYRELHERAEAIAAAIVRSPGDSDGRVLLAREPGIEWVASFFACLYVGRIAVPFPEPRRASEDARWRKVAHSAGVTLVLTSAKTAPLFGRAPESAADWTVLITEEQVESPQDGVTHEPSEIAFLQYTSGSTGDPKGVMVSHENLFHNLVAIRERFGHSRESRGVIWLPPYHDMGLIGGILQPIFVGFPVLLIPPSTFIRAPFRWLEAVSEYGATTSGGPSFAYQAAAQRITEAQKEQLDLKAWSVAFVGAEMVRAEALRAFVEAFSACGFREESFSPCYGLAEATLMVTAPARGEGWRLAGSAESQNERVLCGAAALETEIQIIDSATQRPVGPGEVGEIWVSSPGVARGYWEESESTAAVFGVKLEGFEHLFLKTGDLGFLEEGELAICGRQKDLIVIHGQNYLPADLEAAAARAAELDVNGVVAFSVEGQGEEQAVILYEVRRSSQKEDRLSELGEMVEAAILREFQLPLAACYGVKAPALPRTSSGKIRRQESRRAYLENKLPFLTTPGLGSIAVPQSDEELAALLRDELERVLGRVLEPGDPNRGFFDLGLSSLTAMELKAKLEKRLRVELPQTLIFDYPHLEALTTHLQETLFKKTEDEIDAKLAELEQFLGDPKT